MKPPFRLATFLTTILVTLVPQVILAQTYLTIDGAKYLTGVDRAVNAIASNPSRKNIAQMNVRMPVKAKLRYGYTVCKALATGETMQDIRQGTYKEARNANLDLNTASSEVLFFSTLQVNAVVNFCPQHESQLDK